MRKYASALVPGDKLESTGGVMTVVRAHRIGERIHIICVNNLNQLQEWANYDPFDEFETVTLQ